MPLNPEKIQTLTANGQEYRLYFGMKALRGFELETGKPIMVMFKRDATEVTLNDLACLLKHGLMTEHPEITIDDVDEIIDDFGMSETLDQALLGLEKSLPKGNPIAPLTA